MGFSSNLKSALDTLFGANSNRQNFTDAVASALVAEQADALAFCTLGSAITAGGTLTVNFNSVQFDTDSALASGAFTVPAGKGGKYVVGAQVTIAGTVVNDTYLLVNLLVNGTQRVRLGRQHLNTTQNVACGGTAVLTLAAGDVVTVSAGCGRAATLESIAGVCWFSLCRIPGR